MAQPKKREPAFLKDALKNLGSLQHPRAAIVLCILAVILCAACLFRFTSLGKSSDALVLQSRATAVDNTPQPSVSSSKMVCVDVEGSILNPGVYELPDGSRVSDAIQAAGGKTPEAAAGTLNLARIISDGEQIRVPSATEADVETATRSQETGASSSSVSGTLININTADSTALEKLPGVGTETAKKIIADRQGNGPFKKVEDIQRVSGIGERKFEQMKELICV